MTRLPLPLLGGALGVALAAGCARPPPPAAVAPPAPRLAAAPAPAPGAVYVVPPPSPALRDRAAVADACRGQADRIIAQRDRGQLLREEERDARLGTSASLYDARVPIDRLARQFARDRLADECVEDNRREAPAAVPAAVPAPPGPTPEPPPAAPGGRPPRR